VLAKEKDMTHPVIAPGHVAVITGGASGIGLACAKKFAASGMTVCIADRGEQRVSQAADEIALQSPAGANHVLGFDADVQRREDLERLEAAVHSRYGGTDLLMNNAAVGGAGDVLGSVEYWEGLLATNLWGVIHGTQVFAPRMLARGRPGLIINTGSKQGITTPPGNPAYNVSKAGVKVYTEALQHQLRDTPDCKISARLLIPGFVFTGMTAGGHGTKPPGAWMADQLADFMIARLGAGDFYILCPDNDVDRSLDNKRILWAAGDIVRNRPPLSRWHPDFEAEFKAFLEQS
jgi:NAD(P)-dependent dehydrogenase (short-subunit alcohol dehydrogenase family)